jgi:hypothetical protein
MKLESIKSQAIEPDPSFPRRDYVADGKATQTCVFVIPGLTWPAPHLMWGNPGFFQIVVFLDAESGSGMTLKKVKFLQL